MTLSIKPQYDAKKLVENEHHHPDLNTTAVFLTILISCLAVITLVVIFAMYGSTLFTSPMPIPTIDPGFTGPSRGPISLSSAEIASSTNPIPYTDLGSVNGFVMSSEGLPVDGASVAIYKHMGLAESADKSAGYSTSVMTESDGSYSFNSLPSGVYRFTVIYPDTVVQTIENYAVSPSSSSSYVFRE